jgi:NAD+ diphosphatase
MRYCPHCGKELQPKLIVDRERLACTSCDFVFWNNPTPVAASIVLHEGKVVLVRPKYHPKGRWALIAGYVEKGESAEEAALREIGEETHLKARIERLIGTYPVQRRDSNLLYIAFLAKTDGGVFNAGEEIAEISAFDSAEAVDMLIGTTAGRALSDWLKSEGCLQIGESHQNQQ